MATLTSGSSDLCSDSAQGKPPVGSTMYGCSQLLRTSEAAIMSSRAMTIPATADQDRSLAKRSGAAPEGVGCADGVASLSPTSWLPVVPLIVIFMLAFASSLPASGRGLPNDNR